MLAGCRDRQSIRTERGLPHPQLCTQVFATWPEKGAAQPGILPRREVTVGWDLDVALEVQQKGLACFLGSKKTSLKLATEAVSPCLKGSRVAVIRLTGEEFQESSTEEGQGCPITPQTSLPEGTPTAGRCNRSPSAVCLGGWEGFLPPRTAPPVLPLPTFRVLFPTVYLTPPRDGL